MLRFNTVFFNRLTTKMFFEIQIFELQSVINFIYIYSK